MTSADVAAQYAAAEARAQQLGLRVMAEADGVDGTHYWFVTSSSAGPDADWRRVWIAGGRLQCTCPAGLHGKICGHKALARAAYVAEQQAVSRAEQQQHERQRAQQERRRVPAARTVEYDGRRRNNTCAVCHGTFVFGELIVLTNGQAVHQPCYEAPSSTAPGHDAAVQYPNPDLSWNE